MGSIILTMSNRLSGLRIERLLVLIQIILTPIYFLYFAWKWEENIRSNIDLVYHYLTFKQLYAPEWLMWVTIWIGIPLFFSAPWLIFLLTRPTRVANAYMLVGRALGRVRIDQKLFYALNAGVIYVFFILPVISPLISVLGALVLPVLVLRKLPLPRILKMISILLMWLLLALIPVALTLAFFLEYINLLGFVWDTWLVQVDLLYGIGLCLADAVAIGNFWLMIKEAAAEVNPRERVPYEIVLLLKIVIFVILLIILFNSPNYSSPIINFVTIIATVAAAIEFTIRFGKGLGRKGESKMGYAMIPIFTAVNFLNRFPGLRSVVIILSAALFFSLFAISYYYAEDPDLISDLNE